MSLGNWRKNWGGVVVTASCGPEQIADDKAKAEEGGRAPHVQDLRGYLDQEKDGPDNAIPGGECA